MAMDIPMAGAPDATAPADTLDTSALDKIVQENDIVLFMKGTPDQPQCGFSARAAGVLQRFGHPFHAVNVLAGSDPYATVQTLAQWAQFPTLPQVWVKGELIGGSDIVLEMYENGELKEMLQD